VGDEAEKAGSRQAVQCRFCGHYYIRPCTASTQAKCLNVKLATPLSEPQASIRHHYILADTLACDGFDGELGGVERAR
jgi:hypothetical protein